MDRLNLVVTLINKSEVLVLILCQNAEIKISIKLNKLVPTRYNYLDPLYFSLYRLINNK